MSVPSNLIPTRITQLPVAPVADENSLMMIVYQGNNYQIRVGDLLSVAGVPTTRQVIAGTGMTGGGQLSSNVTLSIAPGGVGSTELASSGVTPGSYGTSTDIPVFTVDATGRVMSATTIPATISGYVPDTRQVIAGTGMTGGGQLSSNVTLSIAPGGVGSTELAASGVTPGSYGTSTDIPVFTVDATGRVMSATTIPATISGYVPDTRQVIAGAGLTGGGALSSNVTLAANLSNATPLVGDNTGSAGVSSEIARADHVHPAVDLSDQAQINGILPMDQGGTARSLVPNAGAVVWSGADGLYISAAGTAGQVLVSGGTGAPTWGTALVVSDQPANVVFAGPAAGPDAAATFRALVTADLPSSGVSAATYGSQAVVPVISVNAKGQITSATNTTINAVTLTTGTISTAPTNGTDIVNKNYADSIATGINFHQACRLATTTALAAYTYNNGSSGVGATITANANGALSIDSVLTVVGNRVLVKNETSTNEPYNGVYTVTQVGSAGTPFILTRATDFDTAGSGVDQIDAGDFFLITAGTVNANTSWVQQTPLPITVGTTAIVFSQFGAAGTTYTAGTGLTLAGTVFSITNTAVAATSYGSASAVGTFTVNAQGQLTAAADVSIAIAGSQITSGTIDSGRISGSYTGITGVGTLTAGTWNATAIGAAYGGTGLTSYTIGDIIYASGTTTLAALPDVATGNVLLSGGVGVAPAWGKVDLTAAVSGTLPVANGGTNATATPTAGAVAYGTGSAYAFTSVGSSNEVLLSGGAGSPTWSAQSALSVGTATNLAGGIASQIPYQTGAGATSFIANGTAGQVLLSAGTSAPAWGGIDGGTF